MDNSIKPIETVYNGYRFRSRLEARWAVFFDAMKIEYQYEVEGFRISTYEGEDIFYLPDFYLPKENCYVEVKGTDEALHNDGFKIAMAVDYEQTPCSNGLLILGDIPNYTLINWGNIPMFSFLYNEKAVVHEYAAFTPYGRLVRGGENILRDVFSYHDNDWSDSYGERDVPKKTTTKCKWSKKELMSYDYSNPDNFIHRLAEAYRKARQARFEHGETPQISR